MRRMILLFLAATGIAAFASPVKDSLGGKFTVLEDGDYEVVPVEYLGSSGSQYIDTGIYWDDETHTYSWDVVGQAVYDGSRYFHWFCGWFRTGGVSSVGAYPDYHSQYIFYPMGTYFQEGASLGNGMSKGDKYGIVENVYSLSNVSIPYSLVLFGRRERNGDLDNTANVRIYGFSAYDNGELVCDLTPVRIGVQGFMLDLVSGELHGNEGSGLFILGPDKE